MYELRNPVTGGRSRAIVSMTRRGPASGARHLLDLRLATVERIGAGTADAYINSFSAGQ